MFIFIKDKKLVSRYVIIPLIMSICVGNEGLSLIY